MLKDLPDDALRMVVAKDCGPLLDYLRLKTCFDVEYVSFVLALAGDVAVNELARRANEAERFSEEEFWRDQRDSAAFAESVSTTVSTTDDVSRSSDDALDPWVPQTTVLSRTCDQIRMVMDDGRTSDWIQATWSNKHLHGERSGNGRYEVQCRKSDLPKAE